MQPTQPEGSVVCLQHWLRPLVASSLESPFQADGAHSPQSSISSLLVGRDSNKVQDLHHASAWWSLVKHGPSMWNKNRECRSVLQCAKGLVFDMSEFMPWFNKLYGIIKIHCQNGTCQNKKRDCEIDSECNLYKQKGGCNASLREFMSSFKSIQKK